MGDGYQERVVGLGDDVSRTFHEVGVLTQSNRTGRYGEVDNQSEHFRGLRTWSVGPLLGVPEPDKLVFNQDADGIGTKVLVSQRTAKYGTAAIDMIAMASDDPAAKGLEPTVLTTVLNVNRLSDRLAPHYIKLGEGAVTGCITAELTLLGGETAVMGDIIQGYGDPEENLWFEWSGTVHAVGHRDRLIDGREIQPGMSLVGFADPGFRSNGISKVREIFEEAYGELWHEKVLEFDDGPQRLGDVALRPSVIFTPVLVAATGGYDTRRLAEADIKGAAHITGGGLTKLGELLLPGRCGADIERPFAPPEAMQLLQRLGAIPDESIYRMLHMGQAVIAATPNPDQLIGLAARHHVIAEEIGVTTKVPGIRIRSAGVEKPGRTIQLPAAV